jgi:hypothetical protein
MVAKVNTTAPANLTVTAKVDNTVKKQESKGVINPPIPGKNATVDEPVKLQVTEEVHSEKKHSHKHKKHHAHHKSKSHSKMSQEEKTELQIMNDQDSLFNDEM